MPRHVLFAELYGLSQNQRNQGTNTVNSALDLEAVEDVLVREITTNYSGKFGDVALLVNCTFTSDAVGQRIFDPCYNWASSRATTSANGVVSTLRQTTVDEDLNLITTWVSTSPNWPVAVPTTRPFFAPKP